MFYDMFFNMFFADLVLNAIVPGVLVVYRIKVISNQKNTYKLLWMILMD